jgi:hypothetical protein
VVAAVLDKLVAATELRLFACSLGRIGLGVGLGVNILSGDSDENHKVLDHLPSGPPGKPDQPTSAASPSLPCSYKIL